jgi:hypothetical protein
MSDRSTGLEQNRRESTPILEWCRVPRGGNYYGRHNFYWEHESTGHFGLANGFISDGQQRKLARYLFRLL